VNKWIFSSYMLLACSGGEQGFGQGKTSDAIEGGAGLLEVYPGEVVWDRAVVDQPETAGFRITSVGESPLRVTEVSISNAGETTDPDGGSPESVFRDLRAFEPEKHTVPFSLEPGDAAEFLLSALFLSAGTAEGQIRIRSNDTEAEGPAPGDYRLTLLATGVDPASGGDDTGDAELDTGDTEQDTGSSR
jgi:hypothetical protein